MTGETVTPTLAAHPATDAEAAALDRLRAALGDRDCMDVAWRVHDVALGRLLLAATTRGLARVALVRTSTDTDEVLTATARDLSPRLLHGGPRLDPVITQLDEYFAGHRRRFDIPVDLQLLPTFRRDVVTALPSIPYGQTRSYGQVAATIGNPRAARAVGSACGANPVPIVVPCHRVVRADGSVGQYAWGPRIKKRLLALEAGHSSQ